MTESRIFQRSSAELIPIFRMHAYRHSTRPDNPVSRQQQKASGITNKRRQTPQSQKPPAYPGTQAVNFASAVHCPRAVSITALTLARALCLDFTDSQPSPSFSNQTTSSPASALPPSTPALSGYRPLADLGSAYLLRLAALISLSSANAGFEEEHHLGRRAHA